MPLDGLEGQESIGKHELSPARLSHLGKSSFVELA